MKLRIALLIIMLAGVLPAQRDGWSTQGMAGRRPATWRGPGTSTPAHEPPLPRVLRDHAAIPRHDLLPATAPLPGEQHRPAARGLPHMPETAWQDTQIVWYYQGWTGTSWEAYRRTFSTYNSAGNLTEYMEQWWEPKFEAWVNYSRDFYTYDSAGNLTEHMNQYYWERGAWVNGGLFLYTYDSAGNLTETLSQSWDDAAGAWVTYERKFYTYDSAGNLTEYMDQYWVAASGVWVNGMHYLYTYDSAGNRSEWLWQIWDAAAGDWVTGGHYLYTYDSAGNLTEHMEQYWDAASGAWVRVNSWHFLYTYDSAGNWTEWLWQYWDDTAGAWVNHWRELYTYNSAGNRTEVLWQDWDAAAGDWVNSWYYLYTYDSAGNLTETLVQRWDVWAGAWVTDAREITTETVALSAGDPALGDGFPARFSLHQNYPNPFNPSTTIPFDLPQAAEVRLAIYDLQGREVAVLVDRWMEAGRYRVVWGGRCIDGQQTPSGMYLARLVAPDYTKAVKLVMMK